MLKSPSKFLLVSAFVALVGFAQAAEDSTPAERVILDTRQTFWRFRIVRETVDTVLESGKVDHVRYLHNRNWFRENPTKVEADDYIVERVDVVRLPAKTSPGWMKPAFDDSTWIRCHGPMLDKSKDVNWKLVLMRGRFAVTDPAAAGDLTFSLTFRGGAVVYLNGEEVARAFMPPGEITPDTPAAPYPQEVYLDKKGYLVWPHDDQDVYLDRYNKRIHKISNFKVGRSKLKKGVNLLAVAIHRAPSPPLLQLRRIKRYPHGDNRVHWCKTGLIDVRLTAPAGSSAMPNVSRQKDKGFVVWNHSIMRKVRVTDYPDPFAPLAPIRLSGVRNGTFAGQVVVGHDAPIKGLNAKATAFGGPGTIPASAVQIRYALPDGSPAKRDAPGPFDSLEEFPPTEAPVYEEGGGSIQPIWVTVRVPGDAAPGRYVGKVIVAANGVKPIDVAVELEVADWTLGDTKTFTPRMDIVQSPESVAMAYEVPLWSDEHFRLLDRTFSLLAPLSAKTLYITCVRRTHFGNEHAMVRWVREANGELAPDFTLVEKYLDVATKHLGRVPGVILYCWEPTESMGHAGGAGSAGRTTDKPILYTLVDRDSGKMRKMKGPAWATPEAKTFWRKLTSGMGRVLAKRGMADSMLFGLVGDNRPTRQAMDDITTGVPNAKWAIHSHYYCVKWNDYDMGMAIALWGIGCWLADPADGRGYGWRNPFWLSYYPREMSLGSSLVEHRTKLEAWMGAISRSTSVYSKAQGARGLGRLGADFWKVVKNRRGVPSATLAGRYPEAYWGQLNLNYGIPHLLSQGKNGAIATVRSEAFRENIQELEARIFIEKALLDEAKKARLGEDLAGRCRHALDKRTRMCVNSAGEGRAWFVSSDWKERTDELFALAAEVARKLRT